MIRISRAGTTAAALLLTSTIGLAACGDSDSSTAASPGSGDTLRVGIKFDQPGMGLKAGADYTGFDVDVARYIAKELGKEGQITFSEAPTPQRETLIKNGQVDYIVGTYSITDKRKADVSFAGPYFVAGQDLLVRADDPSITGPDTLVGKKLCSVKGSTPAQKVKDTYPQVQLQEYDTYSKCVEELVAGTVDALTTDNTILAGYASQDQYKGKLRLVGKTFSTENYGVGLKKGDVEFCNKVKGALEKMISSGDWQAAVDKNLGPAGFVVDKATNPPKLAECS